MAQENNRHLLTSNLETTDKTTVDRILNSHSRPASTQGLDGNADPLPSTLGQHHAVGGDPAGGGVPLVQSLVNPTDETGANGAPGQLNVATNQVIGQPAHLVTNQVTGQPVQSNVAGIADPNTDLIARLTLVVGSLADRVNKQTIAEPGKFRLGAGRTLEEFLSDFERYALDRLGSSTAVWTSHLSNYVESPLSDLLKSLTDTGAGYSVIKKCLIDSYGANVTTKTTAQYIQEFQNCRYDPNEGIRGLACRLNALAQRAYAGIDPVVIDDLIKQQCLSVLPVELKNPLMFRSFGDPRFSLQDLIKLGVNLQASTLQNPEVTTASASAATSAKQPVEKKESPLASPNPSPTPSQAVLVCSYCNKRGHTYEECYRRLGLCFICKTQGHMASQCTESRNQSVPRPQQSSSGATPRLQRQTLLRAETPPFVRNQESGPRTPSVSDQDTNRTILQPCAFCGESGHVLATCNQFELYMANLIKKALN